MTPCLPSLQALSFHERLACPLPQATALQVPRLMGHPGGCSSMRLHNTLLEALADIAMHTPHHHTTTTTFGNNSSSSSSAVTRLHAPRELQDTQSIPPHSPSLDELEAAAAAGPVGGAKAAYVAARLLSAAAWKHLGLEDNPFTISTQQSEGQRGQGGWRQGQGVTSRQGGGVEDGSGGGVLSAHLSLQVLLSSGGMLPSHHTLVYLLGGSADVLTPQLQLLDTANPTSTCNSSSSSSSGLYSCSEPQSNGACKDASYDVGLFETDSIAAARETTEGDGVGVRLPVGELAGAQQQQQQQQRHCIVGWVPCLSHEVYQDIELA